MKNAFTMIELVFVIVVLGILAAVAIPRFAVTRQDAAIAKGRADIAAIRSGIITERQSRLFRGQSTFTPTLDANNGQLFSTVMAYPVNPATTDWAQTGNFTYTFTVGGAANTFTYNPNTGSFTCGPGARCSDLVD